jgi:hypothetical protein
MQKTQQSSSSGVQAKEDSKQQAQQELGTEEDYPSGGLEHAVSMYASLIEEFDVETPDVREQGWPQLHRVMMYTSRVAPHTHDSSEAAPTEAAASSSTSSSTDKKAQRMLVFFGLLPCSEDVNIKGPGGFTALHVACLGQLTAQQRK